MSTGRGSSFALAMVAAGSMTTGACGGNGGSSSDAGDGESVPGHGVTCEDVGVFDVPEGGKIRIELIETAANGTAGINATEVIFWKDQEPANRSFLNGGTAFATYTENNEAVNCFDLRSGAQFEGGTTVANQTVHDTRTYLDVSDGNDITLTPDSGDPRTLSLETNTVSRTQGVLHGMIYQDTEGDLAATSVGTNTFYTFGGAGSADYEFQPTTGTQFTADAAWMGDFKFFLPATFTMTGDGQEVAYFEGVDFTAGADYLVETTRSAAPPQDDLVVVTFAAFHNLDDGGRDFICLQFNGESNLTVPAAVVDAADASGTLLVGQLAHFGWINDGRQLHHLGVTCKKTKYTTTDAQ